MKSSALLRAATCTLTITALCVTMGQQVAQACSRIVWTGPAGEVITGRSMNWPHAFNTHLMVIPRGEKNVGFAREHGLTRESKNDTAIAAGSANIGGPMDVSADGMNKMGLGANLLYMAECDFGPMPGGDKPRISWGAWVQYVLSNYATVAEAVAGFEKDPVYLVPASLGPGGNAAPTLHLALSDPTGDSAVIEYLEGKPVIHHGKEFTVTTNSPTYDKQLTLNNYWSAVDGSKTLRSSRRSEDRFVRAGCYLSKLPPATGEREQLAGVLSVMRIVSVPWGEPDPRHRNIAPTY